MRILLVIATLVVSTVAVGRDYYRGHAYGPYNYPYGDPYFVSPHTARELSRIREELRAQRFRAVARGREQDAQINALRSQANASYQVSASQACYYRTVGGMELCEDLFETDSTDYARCAGLVKDRNPGCSLTR